MSWPTPQDYNEAIQSSANLFDSELVEAEVEVTRLGLPKPSSGAFASVYKLSHGDRHWAVRCFLRPVADQAERYKQIADFILNDEFAFTVDFAYLEKGIRVHNEWYPILKMDWVHGQPLDFWLRDHATESESVSNLRRQFVEIHRSLATAGVAHGDFQHGNVLVQDDGEIRLVDYDGMFVPGLAGSVSRELGHRNYQHPERTGNHFDRRLDNFSMWVIETGLYAIELDPSLIDRLNGCDDALLLRKPDFIRPHQSPVFYLLENSELPELRNLSRWVRHCCSLAPNVVPPVYDVDWREHGPREPLKACEPSLLVRSAGSDIDWQALNKFYRATEDSSETGSIPAVVRVTTSIPETGSLIEDRRPLAKVEPYALAVKNLEEFRGAMRANRQLYPNFGIESLERKFSHAHPVSVIWLLAVFSLFTLAVPIGVFLLIFACSTRAKAAKLYKHVANIVRTSDLVYTVLILEPTSPGVPYSALKMTVEVPEHLKSKKSWIAPVDIFDLVPGVHGDFKAVSCHAFFDMDEKRPIAIFQNNRIHWLV